VVRIIYFPITIEIPVIPDMVNQRITGLDYISRFRLGYLFKTTLKIAVTVTTT
jgi:hypothetical protein